jgi:hypothetical protein
MKFKKSKYVYSLQFYIHLGPKSPLDKRYIMRTNCPLVLVACHKLGHGNHVRSLHEANKSPRVGEGQGQTKAFPNFLCIWTNKEQVFFILNLPQVATSTKPFCEWHALPCT